MIYLSKLLLDSASRQVQNELISSVQMHRTLCHAFPGLSDQEWEETRVLFRVDDDNERLSLLVQSHRAPDWSAFAAHQKGRYLLALPQVKSWEPQFEVGQTLRFRLQANPTFAQIIEGATNKRGRFKSRRVGLFREAERLDWLRRQSDNHGFELPLSATTLRRSGDKPLVFRGTRDEAELEVALPVCEVRDLNDGRRFPIKDGDSQFCAARFEGTLRVSDPEKFAHAVAHGIGKARGFGFGLLSLAPVA